MTLHWWSVWIQTKPSRGNAIFMTDRISADRRSWLMSRIRQRDTLPERIVRRMLWTLGYRYRVHYAGLPGKPDIAFPSRKKAVFVHGCFWHGHESCNKARLPRSNETYWRKKITDNVARDRRVMESLVKLGWEVMVVWQCEIKDQSRLAERLRAFLGPPRLR